MNDSIIEAITHYFSKRFSEKIKRSQSFEEVIKKLKNRKRKLKHRLSKEQSESEIALIKSQLKVLNAQLIKAKELLAEERIKTTGQTEEAKDSEQE